MSAPSEPEKYSIDQMMDRLKNTRAENSIEDGELVTRADGSQAIRVRKKKRRSHQPHKEELRTHRRTRMLQVSVVLILLLLSLFGAGFGIVFANSAPFRESLVKKIALATGASIDLKQFRVNPTTAIASSLTLTWPEGNVLDNLTLRGIKAQISPISFLGDSMVGEEATAGDGTLTLRIPNSGKPAREVPVSGEAPRIRFNHYNIPKFRLLIGDSKGPKIRMENSEATFVAQTSSQRPQLLLTRGDIVINGWPKLRMDRSHIEFRGNEADIIGMRLRHETDSRGVFALSGTVSPYASGKDSTLAVQLEAYLISGIAGPELGHLFSGRIDTFSSPSSNFLSFTPGPDAGSSLSITFRNSLPSPIEVAGFPFLFGLSQTLDDEWFSRPVFDSEIRGVLRREDGILSIGGLNLENKGRMALRGNVAMASDRRLSGTLEIGIAEGMIKTAENPRLDAMFGPSEEGFRWVTLGIGGTGIAPTDNFKALYDAALTRQIPSAGEKIPSFEELTKPK